MHRKYFCFNFFIILCLLQILYYWTVPGHIKHTASRQIVHFFFFSPWLSIIKSNSVKLMRKNKDKLKNFNLSHFYDRKVYLNNIRVVCIKNNSMHMANLIF